MGDHMVENRYTVEIDATDPACIWAKVAELPGVYATGDTMDDLMEHLAEAIGLYLSSETHRVYIRIKEWTRIEDDSLYVLVDA